MPATKRQEKLAQQADIIENAVHIYQDLLVESFSSERSSNIRDKFDEFAADPAIEVIERIAALEGIEKQEKTSALTLIYEAAVRAIAALNEPELAKVFWKDRGSGKRFADPIAFLIEHYPSYAKGLTQAHVRAHDFPLYQALHRVKHQHGWPKDFVLPSKSEANDARLSAMDEVNLRGLANSPPSVRRARYRTYEAKQRRLKKTID